MAVVAAADGVNQITAKADELVVLVLQVQFDPLILRVFESDHHSRIVILVDFSRPALIVVIFTIGGQNRPPRGHCEQYRYNANQHLGSHPASSVARSRRALCDLYTRRIRVGRLTAGSNRAGRGMIAENMCRERKSYYSNT